MNETKSGATPSHEETAPKTNNFSGKVTELLSDKQISPTSKDNEERMPKRNTFSFFWSFKDAINEIPSKDEKLQVYEALTDFAFFGIEPANLTAIGRIAWKLIKPNLESSMVRYDRCVENGKKGAEYGKKGGRPRKEVNPNKNPKGNPLTKPLDKDKEKEKEKECVRTRTREESISPEDKERLDRFNQLMEENAPTFASKVEPISLAYLNHLKEHASAGDIIEAMQEIENKVAGKDECPYSSVVATIRSFLQQKKKWRL